MKNEKESRSEDFLVSEETTIEAELLPEEEIKTIKSMVSCVTGSKETFRILQLISTKSIAFVFNRILTNVNLTNAELSRYLAIMVRFPHPKIDLQKLTDFKFISQDLYFPQVIYLYFELCNIYLSSFSTRQKAYIFFRYIYLFHKKITLDYSVYNLFVKFLEKASEDTENLNFIDFFVSKNCHINFYFVKYFIYDLKKNLGDKIFKIGFDNVKLRKLICTLKFPINNWIIQSWDLTRNYKIPELFYQFDMNYILDDLAYKSMILLTDPHDLIKEDLMGKKLNEDEAITVGLSDLSIRTRSNDSETQTVRDAPLQCDCCLVRNEFDNLNQLKTLIKTKIEKFNTSNIIEEPLSIYNIRLLKDVDLQKLGCYIGKESNINQLDKFLTTFNFKNTDIYNSLRSFLSSFILPGESQIIERIIHCFTVYFVQSDDKEILLIYKKIAYGFIALNTQFHNILYEKKPSFEEYLMMLDHDDSLLEMGLIHSPLDKDTLRTYYDDLKKHEIKMNTSWINDFDKFELFNSLHSFPNDSRESIPVSSTLRNDFIAFKSLDSIHGPCYECKIFAYRNLFLSCHTKFLFLSPTNYLQICKLLNLQSCFEYYLKSAKKDTLSCYKLYLENFKCDQEIFKRFITFLGENADKSKGVFNTLFKNSGKLSDNLDLKFTDVEIYINISKLISDFIKNSEIIFRNSIKDLLKRIVISNYGRFEDQIENFNDFEDDIVFKIFKLNTNSNRISKKFDNCMKLKYFKEEFQNGKFDDVNINLFKNLKIYDDFAFEIYCCLVQNNSIEKCYEISYNDICIDPESQTTTYQYSYSELYPIQLSQRNNIIKHFTMLPSLININIAKNIHSESCPFESEGFKDYNDVVYLLLKTDSDLMHYTNSILTYISDSLSLYVAVLDQIYNILFQLDYSLVELIMKILIKRIKSFKKSNLMCCNKKANNESFLRNLINKLVNDKFIDEGELRNLLNKDNDFMEL